MGFLKKSGNNIRKLTTYQEFVNISNIIEKIVILVGTASLVLAILWSRDGIGVGGKVLGGLSLCALFLFWINRKGHPLGAGFSLLLILSLAFTYLAWHNDGIYGQPFIFFPILLIAAGTIFGRTLVPLFSGIIISLSTFLFILDRIGLIQPYNGVVVWKPDFFIISLIIIIFTGTILMIIMDTIEKNLKHIIQSEQMIKSTYRLTLESWAKALELYGREPEGHSERIIAMTEGFTEALGLDEQTREDIFHGALLHDIGKMGLPDSILLKPEALSAEEMEVSKEHPLLAKDLLENIAFSNAAMNIPIYHHEQWDGKGYPEHLSKNQIPLSARIFAIIDNWVSLTTKQVYRPAWSKEKTKSYILEEANRKFDNSLVHSFLNFLAKNNGENHEA